MLGMSSRAAPLLLLLLLAACAGVNSPERTVAGLGDGVHDMFLGHRGSKDEALVFPGRAVIAVDVETFNGDVRVIADPRADATTVSVRREGTHGFMRLGESKVSLEHIAATAQLVPGSLGPTLQVRVTTSDPEPFFQRAHIEIVAPFVEGVRIRTQKAFVLVQGVEGTIDIESSGGDVRLMTDQPLGEDVVIVNREGAIDFRVNKASTGAFDLETVGGMVRVRATEGGWSWNAAAGTRKLVASLNDGANPIVLRTVDGDIRVAIVADPTAVGAIIVDP